MKNVLIFLLIMSSFLISCSKDDSAISASKIEVSSVTCDSCVKQSLKASTYGIYEFVFWPVSGTPYNVVESPTVHVFKWVNGSWVSYGSTVASMCGYYTYETGGTGTYRALISNSDYYYLRSYPDCTIRTDYGIHAGSGDGQVTFSSPWTQVNARCS